ncbi:hypothetical protein [Aeromicrobium stalagmiti]|uniref:hypothetical protein n=1 Tax=Aeromicrobium stalagmiti TaxID=2738988 RepID=UPI001568A227|nr:hypothetical protein [Aeromicrobium stalagmiti]NRQ51309.1 hypothetical protein [Aeromicrobium stalagmiti]
MQRAHLVGGLVLLAAMTTGCTSSDDGEASSGDTAPSTESTAAAKVSPKTLEGACSLLVGPAARYVDDALAAGEAVRTSGGALANVDRATEVQNQLFTVVAEGPAELKDPAGQLVDYLDDPEAYVEAGDLDPLVTEAAVEIKKTCEG